MLVFGPKACFNAGMLKTEAIDLLGGSVSIAAKAIGVTPQAISGWPEELTDAIRDRVQAALYRRSVTNEADVESERDKKVSA